MSGSPWLVEELTPIDPTDETVVDASRYAAQQRGGVATATPEPPIGIRVQDVVIHDNRKWFGEADIRLDALVVSGKDMVAAPDAFYVPQTFRFRRVADGDRLPTGEAGLLVFMGRPAYFLDLFISVSRDRKGTADLASLLATQLGTDSMQGAVTSLLGLALAAPEATAVAAAVSGAATVGSVGYQALSAATGSTVGLYHASWLAVRDDFGVGRHPLSGAYREKDLSFWLEVIRD